MKITTEIFVERARQTHGDKYDYSKVEYTTTNAKVCIICPIHGEFWQTPQKHLHTHGCHKCSIVAQAKKRMSNQNDIILRFKKQHGDKYDYSKVDYQGCEKKITIICREHGEFQQTPNNHLHGYGCPRCHLSKLETDIKTFLEKHDITFSQEHSFDWLKRKNNLRLDFYLPQYNIAIECQGLQHFKEIPYFNRITFRDQKLNDKIKYDLCQKHGIKVLYYSNLGINYPYHVFEDKNELLEEIRKNGNNSN